MTFNSVSTSTPSKTAEYMVPPGTMHISRTLIDSFKSQNLATGVLLIAYQKAPVHGLGIIHMMMPDSKIMKVVDNPLKYVDTAIPLFIEAWKEQNFDIAKTVFTLVGGSQLFNFSGEASNMLNVGLRNVIVTQTLLNKEGASIRFKETGGNRPRTVQAFVSPFKVEVSQPKNQPQVLVSEAHLKSLAIE